MGKVEKEYRWILHDLSEDNKNRQRDSVALTLLSKFRETNFLHKIITHEKWIVYDNPKHRKSD